MSMKVFALAIAALASSVGGAAAQSAVAPPSPGALQSLVHPGITAGIGRIPGTTATKELSAGWNLFHCYTSIWYTDGSNQYLFGYNWEGTYVYAENNTYLSNEIINICRDAHEYGVYSSNGSTFYELWDRWSD
jgi:hypothetical protein